MRTFLGFLFLFWSQCLYAQELKGKVIDVVDGDTYKVSVNNKTIKVRLLGIDCPEHDQAFGQKVKKVAQKYVQGKTILIKISGKDLYHRALGTVFLENGTNICQELVKTGYAWKYKYSNDPILETLENKARKSKLGLWADPNPISPWAFKKSKKRKKSH